MAELSESTHATRRNQVLWFLFDKAGVTGASCFKQQSVREDEDVPARHLRFSLQPTEHPVSAYREEPTLLGREQPPPQKLLSQTTTAFSLTHSTRAWTGEWKASTGSPSPKVCFHSFVPQTLQNFHQISSTNISGIYLRTYLHSYCTLTVLVPPSLFPCKATFKKKHHIASCSARRNVLEPFLPLLRQQLSVPFIPPPALVCIVPVFISPFEHRWPYAQKEILPMPTERALMPPRLSCKWRAPCASNWVSIFHSRITHTVYCHLPISQRAHLSSFVSSAANCRVPYLQQRSLLVPCNFALLLYVPTTWR